MLSPCADKLYYGNVNDLFSGRQAILSMSTGLSPFMEH